MTRTFHELTLGDVLVAPFVLHVVAAFAVHLSLRPILHVVGFDRLFSNPPVAQLSLYVLILGTLVVLL